MGMLTVTELVKPTIVTIHLILGMTTASLMYWNGLKVVANHNMINLNRTLILIIIKYLYRSIPFYLRRLNPYFKGLKSALISF